MRYVVVTGTSTAVGKTWTTCELAKTFRSLDMAISVRKPCQSYDPNDTPDAELLARASGELDEDVCPSKWSFDVAMAPPIAAAALGREVPTIATLVDSMVAPPSSTPLCLVEGAGGVRSPLAEDGDLVDFMACLNAYEAVLVAEAGLGSINSVRLCLDALSKVQTTVFLNRYNEHDRIHRTSYDWLSSHGISVTPSIKELFQRVSS